jgi:hypothetical protein
MLAMASLVVGYLGHGLLTSSTQPPVAENLSENAVFSSTDALPVGAKETGCSARSEAQEQRLAIEEHARWVRHSESGCDETELVQKLYTRMSELEPGVSAHWNSDGYFDGADTVDLAAGISAEGVRVFHYYDEVIAERVSELYPPSPEPDEGEMENEYLYDTLPEISERERMEMEMEMEMAMDRVLGDGNHHSFAADELEHLIVPQGEASVPDR